MFSMLADNLQDRAVLYVSGEMPPPDREAFDVLLEFHGELRAHVAGLHEAMAGALMTRTVPPVRPPAGLKTNILNALGAPLPRPEPEALVVTNAAGLLEWVNPAFTDMCGYTLDELRGRKPGQLLQGPGTDPAAVNRQLEAAGAKVMANIPAGDHERFDRAKLLTARGLADGLDAMIVTRKDWVKIEPLLKSIGRDWRTPVVVPQLEMEIVEGEAPLRARLMDAVAIGRREPEQGAGGAAR